MSFSSFQVLNNKTVDTSFTGRSAKKLPPPSGGSQQSAVIGGIQQPDLLGAEAGRRRAVVNSSPLGGGFSVRDELPEYSASMVMGGDQVPHVTIIL